MIYFPEMLKTAILAAQKAGDYLLKNFGKVRKIIEKEDRNLATELDLKAEEIIIKILKKQFPSHKIFSEEGNLDIEKEKEEEFLWIIDPLDGTHNYIHKIEIFGVSVALSCKGKVILGVIYLPFTQELYWGQKNKGSFLNRRRIKVSQVRTLKKASVSFDSAIRINRDKILKVLGRVADQVFNIRMLGSSARVLSYLASGRLDIAIEFSDYPWDCAAGKILIEEAGGKFTYLDGSEWKINKRGYIASNKYLHSQILKLVNPPPQHQNSYGRIN